MPMIFVFDCTEESRSELLSKGFNVSTYLVVVDSKIDRRKWEADIFTMPEYTPPQFFASPGFRKREKNCVVGVVMDCAKPDKWQFSRYGLKEQVVYTKYTLDIEKSEEEILAMKHVPTVWCVSSWWSKAS